MGLGWFIYAAMQQESGFGVPIGLIGMNLETLFGSQQNVL
jgi:hypothetical protein